MFTLSLFGPFQLRDEIGNPIALGVKSQALLALLASEGTGTRTRAYLRAMLWKTATRNMLQARCAGPSANCARY